MSLTQRCCVFVFILCIVSPLANGQTDPVTVNLRIDNGKCIQTINGRKHKKFKLNHAGGMVKWVAPDARTSCEIHFNNNATDCPFYSAAADQCNYTCTNGYATSDPATGSKNLRYTYKYGSISINNKTCTVGNNGIVLDH